MGPMISVVVPAFNCRSTIERCMEALRNLNYTNYEVIIVDDGSTDGTQDILKKSSSGTIRCVRQENAGPAAARNAGAKTARGEILGFTDSDCVPGKDWLNSVPQHFDDKKVVGVEGKIETDRLGVLTQSVRSEGGRYLTANMFYRKKDFLAEGGFDERFRRAFREDTDMAIRMASRGIMRFERRSCVYHIPRDITLYGLLKKQEMYFYEALFFKKHGKKASAYSMYSLSGNPAVRSGIAFLALLSAVSAFFIPIMALPAISFYVGSFAYAFYVLLSEKKLSIDHMKFLPFSFLIPLATLFWILTGWIMFRNVAAR